MSSPTGGQGEHQLDGGALGCARLLLLLRDHAAGLPDEAVIHLTALPTRPDAPWKVAR
jgi:tRNA 2-thiouridine synthesizing protein A